MLMHVVHILGCSRYILDLMKSNSSCFGISITPSTYPSNSSTLCFWKWTPRESNCSPSTLPSDFCAPLPSPCLSDKETCPWIWSAPSTISVQPSLANPHCLHGLLRTASHGSDSSWDCRRVIHKTLPNDFDRHDLSDCGFHPSRQPQHQASLHRQTNC